MSSGVTFRKLPLMLLITTEKKSRDDVVGTATGYGLDDRMFGVPVPVG
jgi:hypothetical protein